MRAQPRGLARRVLAALRRVLTSAAAKSRADAALTERARRGARGVGRATARSRPLPFASLGVGARTVRIARSTRRSRSTPRCATSRACWSGSSAATRTPTRIASSGVGRALQPAPTAIRRRCGGPLPSGSSHTLARTRSASHSTRARPAKSTARGVPSPRRSRTWRRLLGRPIACARCPPLLKRGEAAAPLQPKRARDGTDAGRTKKKRAGRRGTNAAPRRAASRATSCRSTHRRVAPAGLVAWSQAELRFVLIVVADVPRCTAARRITIGRAATRPEIVRAPRAGDIARRLPPLCSLARI